MESRRRTGGAWCSAGSRRRLPSRNSTGCAGRSRPSRGSGRPSPVARRSPLRARGALGWRGHGANPDQHCGPRRSHADGAAHAGPPGGLRRRAVREARGLQPGRLGQGPHRRRDDRGGGGRGPDRARAHDDRRGDARQHRHRAGVLLRGQGLRARDLPAPGHEPRARDDPAPVRRAGRGRRVARGHGGGRRGRPCAGGPRRRLPARPVLQPGQPRGAPAHDRPGDPRGPRRRRRRARGGRGDRRDDHRRGRGAQAAQPARAGRRRRAGELARALRRPGGRAPDPGDRRGLRPGRAEPRGARRGPGLPRRGRDPHGLGARAARGGAGRDVLRRGGVGRPGGGPAPRVARQADRRHPARLGRALRERAVLRAAGRGPRDAALAAPHA